METAYIGVALIFFPTHLQPPSVTLFLKVYKSCQTPLCDHDKMRRKHMATQWSHLNTDSMWILTEPQNTKNPN